MHRADDVAAPLDIVRHAAGAGDGVDVVVAPVAIVVVGVECVAAALAAVLAAVHAVVPDDVVPAVAAVAASAVSMTYKARGGCWVQQVSRVLKVVVEAVVAAAAVAGGESEIA